jgi:hypothetical protein
MAMRGWGGGAWVGAEGAGVFLEGTGLFSQEGALALPLPFSIPDLLLASLEIGQQCHFSASDVLAQLGLKALALAFSNAEPGQSHHSGLGLGLAWPRPWPTYVIKLFV